MMTKSISDLAREAGLHIYPEYSAAFQRFHDLAIAQYRESLLAGVGEPQKIEQTDQYGDAYGYTADQMAAAVAIERERCAKVVEEFPHDQLGCLDEVVAAIRGQR